jgi:hypothetical protein
LLVASLAEVSLLDARAFSFAAPPEGPPVCFPVFTEATALRPAPFFDACFPPLPPFPSAVFPAPVFPAFDDVFAASFDAFPVFVFAPFSPPFFPAFLSAFFEPEFSAFDDLAPLFFSFDDLAPFSLDDFFASSFDALEESAPSLLFDAAFLPVFADLCSP